ncbi:MAG TPA: glutamate-5-semialdehyde dehydrogenase [Candidatus Omnitrophica bacterium]|nr:glutamate-5-semialdehyde dehydrogenase [Candidatus Omnitrophota bacterium]
MKTEYNITKMLKGARSASFKLSALSSDVKDRALSFMSQAIIDKKDYIIRQNHKDVEAARSKSLSVSSIDRLVLNAKRISQMSDSLKELILLKDPVGDIISQKKRPNGLVIKKVRVPIGVILIIYESRPNVTSDCIGLCLKSGNVSILRGGSEAFKTNTAIFKVLKNAAKRAGLPEYAFNLVLTTRRDVVSMLLKQSDYIDLVIPRGGEGLIRKVAETSRIPVIKHYKGICSVYVDSKADLKMAEIVCLNAKLQRPSVCNSVETLLLHQTIADKFLDRIFTKLNDAGVEIRGCSKTYKILKGKIKRAKISDWSTEFLGFILAVKIVRTIDEAIDHINQYGSHHSDSIITSNKNTANQFLSCVDSAAVFLNASTRFSDGHQFGMGAEIGISTDKIHARGPMGLEELTIYKYQVLGNGQIRT